MHEDPIEPEWTLNILREEDLSIGHGSNIKRSGVEPKYRSNSSWDNKADHAFIDIVEKYDGAIPG